MSILSSTGKIFVIRTPVSGRFGMYRLMAKLTSGEFKVSWDGVSEITIVTFNKRRTMCNVLHIDQFGTDKLTRKLNEGVYQIYLDEGLIYQRLTREDLEKMLTYGSTEAIASKA